MRELKDMLKGWEGWKHRSLANLYYLRQPLRDFMPVFGAFVVLLVLGTWAFYNLYTTADPEYAGIQLSWHRSFYLTYCLVFMEHLLPWPEHWLLELYYIVLPPIGLAVILDGIVRFSYHILRRDENHREWTSAMAKTFKDHVILCGLGKGGFRILQQLLVLGEKVIVLEKNPENPNLAFARKHDVPVHVSNGREDGVFEDLNLKEAKSIILATNDDLANLEMAMDARRAKPEIRVVLRMYDQELASKIKETFNIHLAFSTSEVAAPLFATSSSDRSIINAFYVEDALMVVAKFAIRRESGLVGKEIRVLGEDEGVFVLSHQRDGKTQTFPSHQVKLAVGDEITVQTDPATLKALHKRNQDPAAIAVT